MKDKRQKLHVYITIILSPLIIGLLSYPFHKTEDFKLFQSLKDKTEFKTDKQDISLILKQVKNKKAYLNLEQVKFYSDYQHAIFIDARSPYEIHDEKIDDLNKVIPNAINISVEDINIIRDEGYFEDDLDLEIIKIEFLEELKTIEKLATLPKDMLYIVYCGSSECDKSENLAQYMIEDFNFRNISIYKGGWSEWKNNL